MKYVQTHFLEGTFTCAPSFLVCARLTACVSAHAHSLERTFAHNYLNELIDQVRSIHLTRQRRNQRCPSKWAPRHSRSSYMDHSSLWYLNSSKFSESPWLYNNALIIMGTNDSPIYPTYMHSTDWYERISMQKPQNPLPREGKENPKNDGSYRTLYIQFNIPQLWFTIIHWTTNFYKSHVTEIKLAISYQFLFVENEYDSHIAKLALSFCNYNLKEINVYIMKCIN